MYAHHCWQNSSMDGKCVKSWFPRKILIHTAIKLLKVVIRKKLMLISQFSFPAKCWKCNIQRCMRYVFWMSGDSLTGKNINSRIGKLSINVTNIKNVSQPCGKRFMLFQRHPSISKELLPARHKLVWERENLFYLVRAIEMLFIPAIQVSSFFEVNVEFVFHQQLLVQAVLKNKLISIHLLVPAFGRLKWYWG